MLEQRKSNPTSKEWEKYNSNFNEIRAVESGNSQVKFTSITKLSQEIIKMLEWGSLGCLQWEALR